MMISPATSRGAGDRALDHGADVDGPPPPLMLGPLRVGATRGNCDYGPIQDRSGIVGP